SVTRRRLGLDFGGALSLRSTHPVAASARIAAHDAMAIRPEKSPIRARELRFTLRDASTRSARGDALGVRVVGDVRIVAGSDDAVEAGRAIVCLRVLTAGPLPGNSCVGAPGEIMHSEGSHDSLRRHTSGPCRLSRPRIEP